MAACGPAGCGAGYCDPSARLCVCPPGARGKACEQLYLPSCRMHPSSPVMACEGFHGVMSCRCAAECSAAFERYNAKDSVRFLSISDAVCFTHAGEEPPLSDTPANLSAVRFYARYSLPTPGWELDPSVPATRVGRMLHGKPRWAAASRVAIKALRPAAFVPLPVASCPGACSHAGTCVRPAGQPSPHCRCHAGRRGAACDRPAAGECVPRCSSHGACTSRACACDAGWFGADCSHRLAGAPRALRFAPTYVYPLPSHLSLAFVQQRDPRRRGMFYTNRVYLEALHSHADALVGEPEDAALFFIPVMLSQMSSSLWEGRQFLHDAVGWIRHRLPFWNRSGGADHYLFSGQDLGGCWMPDLLRSSIVVSHFGFRASEAVWKDARRWDLAKVTCDGWRPGTDPAHWLPPCFSRKKDVVVPVDFSVTPLDRRRAVAAHRADCRGKPPSARRALIYMAGAISTPYNDVYSQGVREFFYERHRNESEVLFQLGGWNATAMRAATFCLAPSGWGYGWRVYVSLAMLCIPVIVQPLVDQAFEDVLPYHRFSLRFNPCDIPSLLPQLRAIAHNRTRLCQMREAALRYYRALMWEPPGVAYEMLQISLCRRALARILHLQSTTMSLEEARRQGLPAWYKCALMTADDILSSSPETATSDWPAIREPPRWF
ncbi:hypothetical protein AB1Y20_009527 [Prymnesium parvum]|uniref:EGF-like domain-containing protein n=1 Tax=Prymnesium parvum TaxID=97485 RepID=A0AB34K5A9_PRYPA